VSGGFTEVTTRSGRAFLRCDECGEYARDGARAREHRCARGADGRAWRRVSGRRAAGDGFWTGLRCPACGDVIRDGEGRVSDHPCERGAALEAMRRDLEAALEAARAEGREEGRLEGVAAGLRTAWGAAEEAAALSRQGLGVLTRITELIDEAEEARGRWESGRSRG